MSNPGRLNILIQSGLGRKRLVAKVRDSLLDVTLQVIDFLWSSGVRETLVRLEIDVPAPFLEGLSSSLAPFITNDRVSISMAHEDWCLLFQISVRNVGRRISTTISTSGRYVPCLGSRWGSCL